MTSESSHSIYISYGIVYGIEDLFKCELQSDFIASLLVTLSALSYIIQFLKYEFTSRETELNHKYENEIIQKKEEIYVFIQYVKLFKSMNL